MHLSPCRRTIVQRGTPPAFLHCWARWSPSVLCAFKSSILSCCIVAYSVKSFTVQDVSFLRGSFMHAAKCQPGLLANLPTPRGETFEEPTSCTSILGENVQNLLGTKHCAFSTKCSRNLGQRKREKAKKMAWQCRLANAHRATSCSLLVLICSMELLLWNKISGGKTGTEIAEHTWKWPGVLEFLKIWFGIYFLTKNIGTFIYLCGSLVLLANLNKHCDIASGPSECRL